MSVRLSEKVSTTESSVYIYVSIHKCQGRSGSGHVIEDKCARLDCSVLQIPFPCKPIDQKGTAAAIYNSVKTRAVQVIKGKK